MLKITWTEHGIANLDLQKLSTLGRKEIEQIKPLVASDSNVTKEADMYVLCIIWYLKASNKNQKLPGINYLRLK